jgi:hypothetical protein
MPRQSFRFRVCAFLAGVALASFSSWASADPPSRVARLGYLSGAVSLSPAGENDWVQAAINRPLTTGDRLWAGACDGNGTSKANESHESRDLLPSSVTCV